MSASAPAGGYVVLVGGFVLSVALLWYLDILPVWSFACLLTLPLAARAVRHLWTHHSSPAELVPSQAATIQMQAAAGILLTVAIVVEHWLG